MATDQFQRQNQLIRDKLLLHALPHVVFDGWGVEALKAGVNNTDLEKGLVYAAISHPTDLVMHFSDWADRKMLDRLKNYDFTDMKIRERINLAVRSRLEELSGYEEAVRRSIAHLKISYVYKTVDLIWREAGDKSVDFNFYTKRALLGVVLTSTTLYWFDDKSQGHGATWTFLDRRINGVMKIPKIQSKISTAASNALKPFKMKRT